MKGDATAMGRADCRALCTVSCNERVVGELCCCRVSIFHSWAWTTYRRRWWTCTAGRRSTRHSADCWW